MAILSFLAQGVNSNTRGIAARIPNRRMCREGGYDEPVSKRVHERILPTERRQTWPHLTDPCSLPVTRRVPELRIRDYDLISHHSYYSLYIHLLSCPDYALEVHSICTASGEVITR